MFFLHDLISSLPWAEITGAGDVLVQRVVADSRLVQPQDLFVAVRGTAIDGHDMVGQAIEQGATVIVGERPIAEVAFDHGHSSQDVTYVHVENTRQVHAHLLRETRPDIRQALASLQFIGVTGTNGKTTVATVLEQCLYALGRRTAFFGTTGYRIAGTEMEATHTTPDVDKLYNLVVQAHAAGVESVVMEVSSHALDQERIDGIPFHCAVFTNLTRDHLDYHETMEEYAACKQRLFTSLQPDAIAVLFGDDPWCAYMKRDCSAGRIHTVGTHAENTALITDIELNASGSRYHLNGVPFESALVGAFNVYNTALCAVVLQEIGQEQRQEHGQVAKQGSAWSQQSVQSALASAKGAAGRMEQHRMAKGTLVVVDYAHTPDALQNAIGTLKPLAQNQNARLHVVFGCGGERDHGKRPLMGQIAAELADEIWITSDNPRSESPMAIIDDILAGMPNQAEGMTSVHVEEDRRTAIERACAAAGPLDIVLIAGKGHENYQVIGTERRHFSDSEVVQGALQA